MDLLVTLDHKYIPPLITLLQSFCLHHPSVDATVWVLHSGMTDEHISAIRNGVDGLLVDIMPMKISDGRFSDIPVIERLPEESFYRLLAFDYLPREVSRCLYLDPDILIKGNIEEMYNMSLDGCYIAAAGHLKGFRDTFNRMRLAVDTSQQRYINSGVMLMDLDAIRQDFTVEGILKTCRENSDKLLLGDQDLVNILFGSKTAFIDELIYNLDERAFKFNKKTFSMDDVREKTAIIHYNGKYKPWLEGYKGELDVFYPEVQNKGPQPKLRLKKQAQAVGRILFSTTKSKIVLTSFLLIVLACVFSYIFFGKELLRIISDPQIFRLWLDKFGRWDEIIFILIRAVQTVVKIIPAEPLEIGSGYAWGAVPGMLYCVIGNLLGTLVILFISKHYGNKVNEYFKSSKSSFALDAIATSDKIYVALFILYLIPGLPKDGFTYLVGFLPVKTVPFLIVTFIARMPSVLSSTLCGATWANQQYSYSILIFAVTILLAALGGLGYKMWMKKKSEENVREMDD